MNFSGSKNGVEEDSNKVNATRDEKNFFVLGIALQEENIMNSFRLKIYKIITGVVTMYPVKIGEINPGSVAKVFEYPTMMLANCGAISKGFAK